MDSFRVTAKDTSVLDRSHLVDEMKKSASSVEMFPVLIGNQIGYFHSVDGGYDRNAGYNVVNFIHEVQGPDSPPNKIYSNTIEAHIGDSYYNLTVADVWQMGEYPDENFVLSLKVDNYRMGPYSFSEALSADMDKREQEFTHNNK